MCGIFGIITIKPRAEVTDAIIRATRSLAHRGPDDEGVEFISDERDGLTVAFSHRRLAILDLSSAGHQPMRDEMTGNWITYNGEVFNFREARRRLEQRGFKFHSETDTEVLLKGYGASGNDAISGWRGMFALGFWNARERSLALIRDRLGIKPLYYYHGNQSFIFASEIRALLATGLVPRRLSSAALASYLAFGSVQQPLTIVENIYAVLPGHTLSFKDGKISETPYWELRADPATQKGGDPREIGQEIAELLLESVRLRLVSDVPIGAFLSGGIDSSSVVAFMRRAASTKIKTFSVYFKEEGFSEKFYADLVARHYGTEHHSILITEDEILAGLPDALRAMDQPSIDGLNTYIVSQATSRSGLKVAISGLGGDELFAGYSFFRTVTRDEQLRSQVKHVPSGVRRAAASAIRTIATGHRAHKISALLRSDHLSEPSVRLYRRLFTSEEQEELLGVKAGDSSDRLLLDKWTARQLANCAKADPINRASALDLGGYLSNTLLRDTDAMSMAHSLEVRVPLIDHKLVERMLRLPGRMKLREREPKWMLVDAARNLPREIVDRTKRGFEIPYKHWLLGALRERVESVLRSSELADIVRADATWRVWQSFIDGRVTWSRVWSLYVLGEWIKNHGEHGEG
jgi:asparagine synthase (glutamine-hydrolysing)